MIGNTNKLGKGFVPEHLQDKLRQLTSKARLAAAARLKPSKWREDLAIDPDFLGLSFTKDNLRPGHGEPLNSWLETQLQRGKIE